MATDTQDICKLLLQKGELKQQIFHVTQNSMQLFCEAAQDFDKVYKQDYSSEHESVTVHFTQRNPHEFQLKFAGDILVFLMHTNVFEFPRDHEIMHSAYIKEDKSRSYCGMIYIYNFLADSFKYNRINDIGYLIGRILINREGHYYVEGKRELARILNNFSDNTLTPETAKEVMLSAIEYTLNFDLLVPEYNNDIQISVGDMMQIENQNMLLRTGKRLGFRFEPDVDNKADNKKETF